MFKMLVLLRWNLNYNFNTLFETVFIYCSTFISCESIMLAVISSKIANTLDTRFSSVPIYAGSDYTVKLTFFVLKDEACLHFSEVVCSILVILVGIRFCIFAHHKSYLGATF